MREIKDEIGKDKCNLCGWSGPETEVIEKELEGLGTTWHCPKCNSEDLDDSEFDPYDDDDPEDEGEVEKNGPVGGGYLIG